MSSGVEQVTHDGPTPEGRAWKMARAPLMAGVAALLTLTVLSAMFLLVIDTRGAELVDAGTVDEVRRSSPILVRAADAYVVADGDGFLALSRRSYAGYPVQWCPRSGQFEEPTTGSYFDQRGHWYVGPAPRGLDRYRVEIRDGRVYVDVALLEQGPPRASRGAPPGGALCLEG